MSKKIDRLRREYPRLTVAERVQLLLAAQERGDRWEIEALDRTCLGSYLPSYITHVAALERAASLLVVQLLAHAVLLATRFRPPAPDTPSDSPLDPDTALLFRRQAALWRGFSAWCRDLGHDPRQVLLLAPLGPDQNDPAHFVLHEHIACLGACSPHLPADQHQIQIWHDFFTRSFQCD